MPRGNSKSKMDFGSSADERSRVIKSLTSRIDSLQDQNLRLRVLVGGVERDKLDSGDCEVETNPVRKLLSKCTEPDGIEKTMMYRFSSDGTVALREKPGSRNECWSVLDKDEISKLQDASKYPSVQHEGVSADEVEAQDGEPYETLSSALAVARTAVRQCQMMKAKLNRPTEKAVEVLQVCFEFNIHTWVPETHSLQGKLVAQEIRTKESLRQNDLRHEMAFAEARLEHNAQLERLKEVNAKLVEQVTKGVDEARVRNDADARERTLKKRIRELEQEVLIIWSIYCFSF